MVKGLQEEKVVKLRNEKRVLMRQTAARQRLATDLRGPQDHKKIQAGRNLRDVWSNLLLTAGQL